MEWMSKALCKDKNKDLWYPPLEEKNQQDYYSVAKAVCNQCEVSTDCLEYGANEVWGCWGGTTPQERKAPHRLQHGTIEKFRLGCSCGLCKGSIYKRTVIPIEKVPDHGIAFDVRNLLFQLNTYEPGVQSSDDSDC